MELFPKLEIGLINGWLLISLFFLCYGITLMFFRPNAIARLYDRSGERNHHVIRRFFGVILVLLWLVIVSLTPLKIDDVVFAVGVTLFSLGLIGFVAALVNFMNTPVDQPVTGGLYRISRHPQQFAVSVAFLGISIAIGSWTALAFMIVGVIGGHYKILAEEEACLKQYGESYKNYMENIPRYFLYF